MILFVLMALASLKLTTATISTIAATLPTNSIASVRSLADLDYLLASNPLKFISFQFFHYLFNCVTVSFFDQIARTFQLLFNQSLLKKMKQRSYDRSMIKGFILYAQK